ncbi:MAG: DUF975 family protein [Sarcina sp.]
MRKEIKSLSKSQLKGRWGSAILAFLVISLFNMGIGFGAQFFGEDVVAIMGINIVSIFISAALGFGAAMYALNFTEGKDDIKDIFSGFRIILKLTGLTLLIGIIVILGTLLLIIPGIIAGLMLSQCYFILAQDPDKGIMECITESKNLMKGRLWEYFILELSFLGWVILSIFTCGIGLLWLVPYQNITFANYYKLIKESEEIGKSY